MSKITDANKGLVGKLNHETLIGAANIPSWLQPYVNYNGVYVGTQEPTDPKMLVWINPNGGANPEIDVDLSNYYTKDETDTVIDNAVQAIDFTPYATRVELEQYDKSYEVDAKIAAIEIPDVDLTGYAKESWVTEQIDPYALKSEIPDVSAYQTETQVNTLISNALANIGVAEEGAY